MSEEPFGRPRGGRRRVRLMVWRALNQPAIDANSHRFFWLLARLHVPEPIYYWFLDRLTDNNGWRPLFYRERRDA